MKFTKAEHDQLLKTHGKKLLIIGEKDWNDFKHKILNKSIEFHKLMNEPDMMFFMTPFDLK